MLHWKIAHTFLCTKLKDTWGTTQEDGCTFPAHRQRTVTFHYYILTMTTALKYRRSSSVHQYINLDPPYFSPQCNISHLHKFTILISTCVLMVCGKQGSGSSLKKYLQKQSKELDMLFQCPSKNVIPDLWQNPHSILIKSWKNTQTCHNTLASLRSPY